MVPDPIVDGDKSALAGGEESADPAGTAHAWK